jgi:hypothetical protein
VSNRASGARSIATKYRDRPQNACSPGRGIILRALRSS